MMQSSFRKIFWGLLLILLEIHIVVIDILPDPLGYFLVFSGVSALEMEKNASGDRNKVKTMALALLFISIPTIFVQNTPNEVVSPYSIWPTYMTGLGILKLVLVFYLLKFMTRIAQEWGVGELVKRTEQTGKVYITATLIVILIQSFLVNLTEGWATGLSVVTIIVSLIMEVTLLILVHKFGKVPPVTVQES
ncbi:hypothetical protein FA727_13755 [Robertmurraya kyonggiensis]|uniref:Uncharacterized protein n=1 Tax=Robertmurraya kyonggiensis TaxID=1037680 RepID=A0A4U1D4K5_9BACI|nr:hypothetical protein FA727_13755 [Robertmurraya kyonggiensis]